MLYAIHAMCMYTVERICPVNGANVSNILMHELTVAEQHLPMEDVCVERAVYDRHRKVRTYAFGAYCTIERRCAACQMCGHQQCYDNHCQCSIASHATQVMRASAV